VAYLSGAQPESLYGVMNALAENFVDLQDKLQIATTFSGTREQPSLRGSVTRLGEENFTPRHFVCATLEGIVEELYDRYDGLPALSARTPSVLVGSGNGIRKNAALQRMFSRKFDMTVKIPAHGEEASFGATLFALVGAGAYPSMEEAQKMIHYMDEEG
jgi:sugar (pentulose or hexulose) kinase